MDGAPLDLVGEVIGERFRVDAFAGEGILSVVYKGRHIDLGLTVAIKCLHLPPSLDPALAWPIVENFLEGCRLHHELSRGNLNIAQTITSGSAVVPRSGAALQYYVREWFEGESLAQDLLHRRAERRGGRSLDEALTLLDGAAEGLAYAHGKGVAHLSLRPSNIFLIEEDGAPCSKILDFGVGKAVDVAEVGVLGSLAVQTLWASYAAPEQLRRQLGESGPWTDVYGLALVLLEVLSGRPVFDASSAMSRAAKPDLRPSPWDHGVRVTDALERVLRRALTVDPTRRTPTIGAFWSEVRRAVRSGELFHVRPGAARPPRRRSAESLRRWRSAPSVLGETELTPLAPPVAIAPPSGKQQLPDLFPADADDLWGAEQTAKWDVMAIMERAAALPEAHEAPGRGGLTAIRMRRSRRPRAVGAGRQRRPEVAPNADGTNRMPVLRDLASLASLRVAAPEVSPSQPPPSPSRPPSPMSPSQPAPPQVQQAQVQPPSVSPSQAPPGSPSQAPASQAPVSAPPPGPPSQAPPSPPERASRFPQALLWVAVAVSAGIGALVAILLSTRLGPAPAPRTASTPPSAATGISPTPTVAAATAPTASVAVSAAPSAPSAPSAAPSAPVASASAPPAPPVPFRLAKALKSLDKVADLAGCHTPGGLWGSGDAVVEFGASGRPTRITLGTPYRGAPAGACVSSKLEAADMGPFEGPPQRVVYTFKVPSSAAR